MLFLSKHWHYSGGKASNMGVSIQRCGYRIVAGAVAAVVLATYTFVAWYAHPSDHKWLLDVIEGMHQFAIDDAYRFFETRRAFEVSGLWSWAYLLPVDALFRAVLHYLTDSDVVLMRLMQSGINLLALYCVYRSCILLGVRPWLAFLSCISLSVMPLFVLVSMSFYGESLLTAMLALAMHLFLRGKYKTFLLIASLMPLVQLEGLFLISGYFLFFLQRKNWRYFLLLAVPGFLYFLNVMYVHRSVEAFLSFTQMAKLYPALPVPIQERGWIGAFETLNPAFLLISITGGVIAWRKTWPFLFGALFWFAGIAAIMSYTNGYEPRYLLPCLPVLFVTFSIALNRLVDEGSLRINMPVAGAVAVSIVVLLSIENMGQSDPFRDKYLGGKRWPIGEPHIGAGNYIEIRSRHSELGNDAAIRVEEFLRTNHEYKLLVINQHEIFYYLDRGNMPDDVRVAYTSFAPELAYPAFGGRFYALSPDHPQADFYRFHKETDVSTDKAVFVGDFSFLGWEPVYRNSSYSVYELGYEIVEPPERIYIHHQMDKEKATKGYFKDGNLCKDAEDYVCPDWRPFNYFR